MWRRRRFNQQRLPGSKNYVPVTASGVASGVASAVDVANAVVTPAAVVDVNYPCRIKSIYLDMSLYFTAAPVAGGRIDWLMFKSPSSSITNAVADPDTGLYAFSGNAIPYVFAAGRGNPGQEGNAGTSQYRIVGRIKVPKRFQLMNQEDSIRFNAKGTGATWGMCGMFTYLWRA